MRSQLKTINEGNACNAFLGIIPFIAGTPYSIESCPDAQNTNGPEVDYILSPHNSGFPLIAVEITTLELFEGQLNYVNRSWDIVNEVNSKCYGKLPADRYFYITIPDNLVDSLRNTAKKPFFKYISTWIVSEAGNLKKGDCIKERYGECNITLMCMGSDNEMNGTLGRVPIWPEQISELREERLRISIDHGKKLDKYKNLGYETALLLEDISDAFRRSALLGDTIELMDYFVVFRSNYNNGRMIRGEVWKEKQTLYKEIPGSKVFHEVNGKWMPRGY